MEMTLVSNAAVKPFVGVYKSLDMILVAKVPKSRFLRNVIDAQTSCRSRRFYVERRTQPKGSAIYLHRNDVSSSDWTFGS